MVQKKFELKLTKAKKYEIQRNWMKLSFYIIYYRFISLMNVTFHSERQSQLPFYSAIKYYKTVTLKINISKAT
jgi:hypothetical protein